MTITVAGAKKEVKEGLTLSELIELEKVETPEYVTVSINEEFVASDHVADTVLKEGDNVEFLYFMGGGYCEKSTTPQQAAEYWPSRQSPNIKRSKASFCKRVCLARCPRE